MKQYHDLLRHVLNNGVLKPTRAKLGSTGQNVNAISVFGYQTRYNLSEGFPMVTTKHISFNNIAHELIWFLSGDTHVKYLHDNNCHIWDEWVGEDGTIGDGYGKQWRKWKSYREYVMVNPGVDAFFKELPLVEPKEIDQIKNLIDNIEEVKKNPLASCGRRLILSAWNVGEISKMNLPPCHCLAQFDVTNGKLSCHLYQRSADAFLGVPYNIASYALLTHLLANVTELEVGEFIHSFGDLHIYENHVEQVKTQLCRTPFPLPTLNIHPMMKGANPYLLSTMIYDFALVNYKHHPKLPGEVAV